MLATRQELRAYVLDSTGPYANRQRRYHEAPGLCFDPSHLAWLGIDYLRAARESGSRIYHAHAKDTECLPEAQYRYGVIDWPAYITALLDIGYDGPLVVEHEDRFWSTKTDPEHALKGLVLAQRFLAPLLV